MTMCATIFPCNQVRGDFVSRLNPNDVIVVLRQNYVAV